MDNRRDDNAANNEHRQHRCEHFSTLSTVMKTIPYYFEDFTADFITRFPRAIDPMQAAGFDFTVQGASKPCLLREKCYTTSTSNDWKFLSGQQIEIVNETWM